ncbi:hypothetical protein GCM10010399_82750 [Dactylosporangium fulvum]|uniref:Uncharacterized protein n=1 Tax=Dactylosporangium fulvum TaxID=53359 RepID=A0ABY5W8P0_9ACTN|nr:hypothetical protein [Dactylosporangium fulvum]UWP85854.1 hypothetical protein Dfulv_17045 [Dactylosporangium fulvum]
MSDTMWDHEAIEGWDPHSSTYWTDEKTKAYWAKSGFRHDERRDDRRTDDDRDDK